MLFNDRHEKAWPIDLRKEYLRELKQKTDSSEIKISASAQILNENIVAWAK